MVLADPSEFWAHAVRNGDCLEWSGTRTERGYGQVLVNGRMTYVHRHAYVLTHGAIPCGHEIRHDCDNPPCFEPRHLLDGTHADNMNDMRQRDRGIYGERVPGAKLTDAAVREIYAEYRDSQTPLRVLAARHGVNDVTIFSIVSGRAWVHVTGGERIQSLKRTTSVERTDMVRLWNEGQSMKQISAVTGRSKEAIRFALREVGIVNKPGRRKV